MHTARSRTHTLSLSFSEVLVIQLPQTSKIRSIFSEKIIFKYLLCSNEMMSACPHETHNITISFVCIKENLVKDVDAQAHPPESSFAYL